jgi:hypothetical protein
MGVKEPSIKPWQDPNWRALLTGYLGRSAPKDVQPISDETLQVELEVAKHFPETERPKQILEAYLRKAQADVNDFQWSGWWNHLHVTTFNKLDPVATMRVNLTGNFQAASVVLLCALPSTPPLRHWWLVTSCVFWLLVLVLDAVYLVMTVPDPRSSFTRQMEYLQERLGKEKLSQENETRE